MLGFIPFFILAGAAISIPIFRFVQRGVGFAWIFAVLCSFASWGTVIFIKNRLPFSFDMLRWSNIGVSIKFPFFEINLINWPFIFVITAIVCAVIISSSIRLNAASIFPEWTGILALGSIGILGSMAGNLLTIIMVFGLLDLIELTFFTLLVDYKDKKLNSYFLNLFWRFTGFVILLMGLVFQFSSTNSVNSWNDISSSGTTIILFGCLFRLGMVPFTALSGKLNKNPNGIFVIRILISLLLVLSILFKLPLQSDNTIWKTLLLGYLLIVANVAALKIVIGSNKEDGLDWQLLLGSIFIAEFLYGFSSTGIYFVLTAIPIFIIFFLDVLDSRFLFVLSLAALFGFSGLPFTPNDSGLAGFSLTGTVPGYLFLFPCMVFFAGMFNQIITKHSITSGITERWLLVVSPLGILITVFSIWIISYFWTGDTNGFVLSIQALIMTIGGLAIFTAKRFGLLSFLDFALIRLKQFEITFGENGKRLFKSAYFGNIIQFPNKFILGIFEGDGGILWAILCLVLVITIIRTLGYS